MMFSIILFFILALLAQLNVTCGIPLLPSLVSTSTLMRQETAKAVDLNGTIVSVRGDIIQIRPFLRPKMVRASISEKTELSGYRKTQASFFKPGVRILGGGRTYQKGGATCVRFFWIAGAKERIGDLREKKEGLDRDGDFASCGGVITSLSPFQFSDDKGTVITGDISSVQGGMFEIYHEDRNSLLIGVRINLRGVPSPDGVINATVVSPNRDYSAKGTMFGEVKALDGNKLIIRPRYSREDIEATLIEAPLLLTEKRIDPASVRVGDRLTFWGQKGKQANTLNALALLVGEGRYPNSTGDGAPIYVTGKIASLEPEVTLKGADGVRRVIHIPAQMPFARLLTIEKNDVKPGSQGMFVLERDPATGGFMAKAVILNASPWVGYGG